MKKIISAINGMIVEVIDKEITTVNKFGTITDWGEVEFPKSWEQINKFYDLGILDDAVAQDWVLEQMGATRYVPENRFQGIFTEEEMEEAYSLRVRQQECWYADGCWDDQYSDEEIEARGQEEANLQAAFEFRSSNLRTAVLDKIGSIYYGYSFDLFKSFVEDFPASALTKKGGYFWYDKNYDFVVNHIEDVKSSK